MTKHDYIEQADAICAKQSRAYQPIPSDAPIADAYRQLKSTYTASIAHLKALDRPAGQDQELDHWFELLDRDLAVISQGQRAAEDGDRAKLTQLLISTSRLEDDLQGAAQQFGFHDCAQ